MEFPIPQVSSLSWQNRTT